MTITIRNLKRRPGGRESIRERTYETDEISIGREADNDLQLLDLRIALKHAVFKTRQKRASIFSNARRANCHNQWAP